MIRKFGNTEGLEEGEPPVKEGFVRVYEFLHGYEDITEEEYIDKYDPPKGRYPHFDIFREELQKEINREIIDLINKQALKND